MTLVDPYVSFPASVGGGITFVGVARAVATGAGSVNITLPAGSAIGDGALVVGIAGKDTAAGLSGYSPVTGVNPKAGSVNEMYAGTKTLNSTDVSTNGYLTVPGDPYGNGIEYVLYVWRGGSFDVAVADTGSPFTSPDTVCVIPSAPASAPGVGSLLIGITGGRAVGTSWGSAPAGWETAVAQIGSYVSLWAGHRTLSASGATGTASVTNVGAANKEFVSLAFVVMP